MDKLKVFCDKDMIEATSDECPNCKSKKYRVHGKVVTGSESGNVEIYYYECDNIKCRKIFIKKNK